MSTVSIEKQQSPARKLFAEWDTKTETRQRRVKADNMHLEFANKIRNTDWTTVSDHNCKMQRKMAVILIEKQQELGNIRLANEIYRAAIASGLMDQG